LNILRYIHQVMPRTPSRRQVKSRSNGLWNLIRVSDNEVVLSNRHGHATNICLLEGIRTQEVRSHLTSDGHDRNRVQVGISNWGHQVDCARTRGGNTHANLAGRHRITFGSVSSTLLVAGQHVAKSFGTV